MKKILLSCVAILGLGILTSTAMAAPVYQSTIGSISDALNKSRSASLVSSGLKTVISIINYSEQTIRVNEPDGQILSRQTSDRIISPDYAGLTRIVLSDYVTGNVFFPAPGDPNSGYVTPFAVVSVYVSQGRYVVFVTE